MNAPIIMQRMTREQACLLLESLYKWADSEIHRDAYEDAFVSDYMASLCHVADCLATVLEVSDDYEAEAQKYKARDFFNGDVRRAMEA